MSSSSSLMPSSLAVQVLERLLSHPSLRDNLQFFHIQRFLELVCRLWQEIVPPEKARPLELPQDIERFLAAVLDLQGNIIQLTWHAFSDLAESMYLGPKPPSIDDNFKEHGHDYSMGAETILPPVSFCIRSSCKSVIAGAPRTLTDARPVEARLYTLRRGILPVFSKSTYCRDCNTRYYHNYYVNEAHNSTARREYYSSEMPDHLHVFSVTCLRIAQVYNSSLAHTSDQPSSSRLKDELAGDLVLEAFLLHAILRDKMKRKENLVLPHNGHQNHRLDEALAERNYRMVGTGQEQWAHTCSRCTKFYKGDDGNWYRMSAGVHDGVTVRHLACSVHDCTEALESQRDLFCQSHSHLNKYVAFVAATYLQSLAFGHVQNLPTEPFN
ncbi:hypothetical protein C8R43DRAFT_942315 [Mycena crocata]|nr:hypothetical protein C8R43DRAFT_942315 [Mycena crocata]